VLQPYKIGVSLRVRLRQRRKRLRAELDFALQIVESKRRSTVRARRRVHDASALRRAELRPQLAAQRDVREVVERERPLEALARQRLLDEGEARVVHQHVDHRVLRNDLASHPAQTALRFEVGDEQLRSAVGARFDLAARALATLAAANDDHDPRTERAQTLCSNQRERCCICSTATGTTSR
jgi:hypothetical protein